MSQQRQIIERQPIPDIEPIIEEMENSDRVKEILETVDSFIKLHLHYEYKDNEGQDALIFKLSLETDLESLSAEDRSEVEAYIGAQKSLKILKVSSPEKAAREYEWQLKAWHVYDAIPSDEKGDYAAIPKPFRQHTIDVDNQTRERLNRQNANLESDKVSAILMEWVEGEDLLTSIFRKFLSQSRAYAELALNPKVDLQSLMIAVNNEFNSKGVDYHSLSVVDQYTKLFQAISSRNDQVLTRKQIDQIENTINLLHQNGIYHNDLHLRNFVVEANGGVSIIDFARADVTQQNHENNIDDNFVSRFIASFDTETTKLEQKRKTVLNDLERIKNRDRRFLELVKKLRSVEGADLMQFLSQEAGKWKTDEWEISRMVALHNYSLESNPAKAIIIREFMKEQLNKLPLESREIITLGIIEKEFRQ